MASKNSKPITKPDMRWWLTCSATEYDRSIVSNHTGQGRVRWDDPCFRPRVRAALEGVSHEPEKVQYCIEHAIIVCFAGVQAQKRYKPRTHWRYAASGAGKGGILAKGTDYQQAHELLCRLDNDENVREKHWHYLEARAKSLVEQYWPRIGRLAALLLERETVDDIREAIRLPTREPNRSQA